MTFEIYIFAISIAIVVALGILIIEHDIAKITRSIKESKAAYNSDIHDILDKISHIHLKVDLMSYDLSEWKHLISNTIDDFSNTNENIVEAVKRLADISRESANNIKALSDELESYTSSIGSAVVPTIKDTYDISIKIKDILNKEKV
mgnify:FL=1